MVTTVMLCWGQAQERAADPILLVLRFLVMCLSYPGALLAMVTVLPWPLSVGLSVLVGRRASTQRTTGATGRLSSVFAPDDRRGGSCWCILFTPFAHAVPQHPAVLQTGLPHSLSRKSQVQVCVLGSCWTWSPVVTTYNTQNSHPRPTKAVKRLNLQP